MTPDLPTLSLAASPVDRNEPGPGAADPALVHA